MKPLQVGDRVRINCPDSYEHGKETTVINIINDYQWSIGDGPTTSNICYEVDIPLLESPKEYAGFEHHELIPLYDGDQAADQSFSEIIESLKTERIAQ